MSQAACLVMNHHASMSLVMPYRSSNNSLCRVMPHHASSCLVMPHGAWLPLIVPYHTSGYLPHRPNCGLPRHVSSYHSMLRRPSSGIIVQPTCEASWVQVVVRLVALPVRVLHLIMLRSPRPISAAAHSGSTFKAWTRFRLCLGKCN